MACRARDVTEVMARDRITAGTWIIETTASLIGISDVNQKYFVNFGGANSGGMNRVFIVKVTKTSYLIYANPDVERFMLLLDGSTPEKFDIDKI